MTESTIHFFGKYSAHNFYIQYILWLFVFVRIDVCVRVRTRVCECVFVFCIVIIYFVLTTRERPSD